MCITLGAQSTSVKTFSETENADTTIWVSALSQVIVETDTTTVAPQNKWKPNPMRAVWMGAIIPGFGQIYNRKYWKLPIVYGGFLGCAYAISWNGAMYNDYRNAYYDILDKDETTNSFLDILPEGYTVEMMGGMSNYTTILNNKQNTYRRYRDLSIIATIAFYALTLVDAYVDAQLYDFDISPDLSLMIEPTIFRDTYTNNRSAELHFTLKF